MLHLDYAIEDAVCFIVILLRFRFAAKQFAFGNCISFWKLYISYTLP